ncbi:recombinase family protein [Arthrobacter livingstonensis]|uniref:recombinase family protein n=1 Tax=Arthrobacter livingstonensis TaxID=670078 RepID=UPI0024830D21|nr:recombinase family protein [Arthrobacter livingstonensis]
MLTVLAAIAQLERKTIRERQAEGIAIAKRNGVYDRVPKIAPEQIQLAREYCPARAQSCGGQGSGRLAADAVRSTERQQKVRRGEFKALIFLLTYR